MEKTLKTGEKVKVTGKSGDYFRVFLKTNGNIHHDWFHKDMFAT